MSQQSKCQPQKRLFEVPCRNYPDCKYGEACVYQHGTCDKRSICVHCQRGHVAPHRLYCPECYRSLPNTQKYCPDFYRTRYCCRGTYCYFRHGLEDERRTCHCGENRIPGVYFECGPCHQLPKGEKPCPGGSACTLDAVCFYQHGDDDIRHFCLRCSRNRVVSGFTICAECKPPTSANQ